MDISNRYCLYVGTARGTIEYTTCKQNEGIKFEIGEERSEITAFEWGRTEDEILVGYNSGKAASFDTTTNKFTNQAFKSLEGDEGVVGLGCITNSVIIAKQDGVINLWNNKKVDYFSLDLEERSSLLCMKVNINRGNTIGTGGEFNDFKLWDVETKQCIFKAKSLGHDELNLPIPTSVRGISFFSDNERLSACATKEGYVLLYDDRAQRKPVTKYYEKRASFTTIASTHKERQCLVGTTKGYMQLLDLKAGKCLRTFKSFTGSVTSIVCDAVEPYVATTSLDRYLRIHNLDTKEIVYKCYLKQNLTKILMKPIIKEEPEDKNVIEKIVDEEYEDLFNSMETVEDKKKPSKKRIINSSSTDVTSKKKKKKIIKT